MSKGWDNATLKKLKSLTAKGLSTAEIGKKLGISKNAVVGKLNRLGWNSKAGGVPSATELAAKKAVKATKVVGAIKKVVKTIKKAPAVAKKVEVKKIVKKAVKATKTVKVIEPVVKPSNVESKLAKVKKTYANSKKNMAMHQQIVQHSLEMANLKPDQCRWPIGDPDTENFHFCGEKVFTGKPYCYKHCKEAYQFASKKK